MMNEVFPQGYAWLDGNFVELSKAKIPILDWGFLRSDATYDVVHVWKGCFFRLDLHIERFYKSTQKLRMPCQMDKNELKKILAGCVKKGGLENAYVEMIQQEECHLILLETLDKHHLASWLLLFLLVG